MSEKRENYFRLHWCCNSLKSAVDNGDIILDVDCVLIYAWGEVINYCPFCGAKLEIG